MSTETVCLACHQPNRRLARFCDQCGERLRPATRSAVELRQGTVVFCDLVGSSILSTQLDSDALVDLYARYWRFVSEAAKRYSGYINRTEGDGAFLLFGYPHGGEDAAECAVRTCLELAQGIAAGVDVPEHPLALRIGAATGTIVIAGAIDAAMNRELALLGPVPDRAARLTTLASPGSVFIDADTRRLAGRFFSYRDLGPRTLKNVEHRVGVWEVLGETSVVSRFDARHGDAGRETIVPIGRDEELQRLRDCWLTTQNGRGQVVWISGEPGIGKSSLARYFAATLPEQENCLEMHFMARSERSPLFPVGAFLRRRAGFEVVDIQKSRASKAREFLGTLLPAQRVDESLGLLASLFGLEDPADHAATDPDALRERTIALLCELFASFARRGATLLSCEDLHWADATSIGLLSRLAQETAQLPMLVLVTSRTSASLASQNGGNPFAEYTSIELQPLDEEQASMMVRRVAAVAALSGEQIAGVVARAEGLPLIIEELAFSVGRQSDLGTLPEISPGAPRDRVPSVLKAIVQSRIDRFPSVRHVVHTASVLGREFSMNLMIGAATDSVDVPLALAEAIDLGLLNQDTVAGVATLRFKHGLIQEAVYDSMLASKQRELHSRVADLLERGVATPDESTPDARAHHLLSAERFFEGVQCLYEAAFATASRAAYVESRGYAAQGLQWLERVPTTEARAQLEMLLLSIMGAALSAVRGYAAPEVAETYRKAHDLCNEGGDPVALFPIARGLAAFYFVRGQMSTAGTLAAQCVELAAKTCIPDFEVEALSIQGYTDSYLGKPKEGRLALERAILLGESLEGPFRYTTTQHPVTAALALLGNAAWAQGDADTAEATVEKALAFANELQRPFDIAYVHGWAAGLRNLQRRWEEAQAHAQQCHAVSEKFALRIWLATATMQGCIAAASMAAAPGALAMLQASLHGFLLAGAEVNSGYFRWGIARGQRLVGDLGGAIETVRQALAHVDRTDEAFIRGELLILAAELESDKTRVEDLLLEAIQEGVDAAAPTLALRAGLQLLRHRGVTSDNPQRELAAQLALDGRAAHVVTGEWIHEAWAGVSETLRLGTRSADAPRSYQRSPSSIDSTIEH